MVFGSPSRTGFIAWHFCIRCKKIITTLHPHHGDCFALVLNGFIVYFFIPLFVNCIRLSNTGSDFGAAGIQVINRVD